MEQPTGAKLADLVLALKQRGIPLPHEVGTFVALQVCDALAHGPGPVTAEQVYITELGRVEVVPGESAGDPEVTQAVIQLLSYLLVASAPGVPDKLLSLVERGPEQGYHLECLRDELEAALVPLNRAATTRILARIAREAFRVTRSRPLEQDDVPEASVDQALDALLGVDTEEAGRLRDPVVVAMPAGAPPPSFLVHATVRGVTALDQDGKPTGRFESVGAPRLEEVEQGRRRRRRIRRYVAWGLGVTAAAGLSVGWWLWSRADQGRTGRLAEEPVVVVEDDDTIVPSPTPGVGAANLRSQPLEPMPAPLPAQGLIRLKTVPEGAQVLLHVPADMMPVTVEQGMAHEFVALPLAGIDEAGHAALRAVIPADGVYLESDGGPPVFELNFFTDAGAVAPRFAPGPSLLRAETLGQPGGEPGAVRFRVDGAYEIFKFLGVTPTPDLGPLPTDRSIELRLERRGYVPKTVLLSPERWRFEGETGADGEVSVELTLALEPTAS